MKKISTKKTHNIFITLLEALHVKHTKSFSDTYYNEHPHKDNLYGLSRMLSVYKIDNEGIRLKDKEKMFPELEAPFIAYTGTNFITVTGINDEHVDYIWKDKKIRLSKTEFISKWSGVVLLAEPTENSIEPDYKVHHRQDLFAAIKKYLLIAAIILLLGISMLHTRIYADWKALVSLFINLSGLYVCYLLLLKQMHVHSKQADKICSLLISKNDCNNILDTDAAKIMDFSWSEVGFGYFVANLSILILYPSLYHYAALVNLCALPYTVWSIGYQKFKAKQWCLLCLLVQGILWLLFIVNLSFGMIKIPAFIIQELLVTGCIYLIPILVLNRLTPVFFGYKKQEKTTWQLNSLKANDDIFRALLKEKTKYEINKSDSIILFGNPEAKNLITVITNPHCNPCAQMHARLENLLKDTNCGYCIQYILTSFKELEDSSRFFIDLYRRTNTDEFLSILNKWYHHGKNDRERFFQEHEFDHENPGISAEYQRHIEWVEKTNISATPTILFNGYELPDQYTIEDMKYFYDINL